MRINGFVYNIFKLQALKMLEVKNIVYIMASNIISNFKYIDRN